MSKKNTAQPANPYHPGEILLEEYLRPGKITQAAFARKIGWTKARLNEFVLGKRGVTADAALDRVRHFLLSRGMPVAVRRTSVISFGVSRSAAQ